MLEVSRNSTLATPASLRRGELVSFLLVAFAVLRRDVRAELRTRQTVAGSLVFGLLVVVVFNFAFQMGGEAGKATAAGALWLAVILTAMMGFNFIFAQEREQGGMDGLVLAGPSPEAIFLGKLAGALLFTFTIEAVLFPLFALFANLSLLSPVLLAVVLLGTFGLVTAGTLFSAMAVSSRARELFLPLLLLPVVAPVLIAAVESTRLTLLGEPAGRILSGLSVLVAFDVVFIALAPLLFQFVMEEMSS